MHMICLPIFPSVVSLALGVITPVQCGGVYIICLFVSLLSHFWLIHFFYLRLLYQPYLGLCQAPCVQSHQRQPMSAVAITACKVQVSAADSSNCSHWSFEAAVLPINPNIYTDQWEPIVMYHSITFTFTGPYTTMQPMLLTSWLQLLSYKV